MNVTTWNVNSISAGPVTMTSIVVPTPTRGGPGVTRISIPAGSTWVHGR